MNTPPPQQRPDDAPELPPVIHASPSDLPIGADDSPMWWRPTLGDSLRHIGWRWILVVPIVLVLALLILAAIIPGLRTVAFAFGFKLILVIIGLTASLAAYVYRTAARGRKEPFCIHCGYNLTGLPDGGRCPECGRSYSWRVIEEYRRDPAWFIQRWHTQRMAPPAHAPFEAGTVRSKRRRDGT